MNKKIFIGSIIAVAVLILVSFTSVVGYRRLTSDVKASPLFNIRSSRAIDEERDDLTCEYVGKEEEKLIPIPIREYRQESYQKMLKIISNLNEEEINRLIELVISKKNIFNDELTDNILPNRYTINGEWILGCFLKDIVLFIYIILMISPTIIFFILEKILPTSYLNCPTSMCKECQTLQI